MTLRADAPEYIPLRTFRDDDLLDPGSDPLIALMGALSNLNEGERVVARPDAALPRTRLVAAPHGQGAQTPRLRAEGTRLHLLDQVAADRRRDDGRAGHRRSRRHQGIPVGAGRGDMEGRAPGRRNRPGNGRGRLGVVAVEEGPQPRRGPDSDTRKSLTHRLRRRATGHGDSALPHGAAARGELLGPVAAAYRHYNNPAGARFKVSRVRRTIPDPQNLHPPGPGLFGGRSVLGVREIASLWHPPGAGDETPLVERSGARALNPSAKGTRGGALVGDTTAGARREIRFPEDLLRRHHLYVARTRMGKSTLMHHVAVHKMQEKAAGRDSDAIVVIDPHTDLVAGILEHVPEELVGKVRIIDLSDGTRSPGINLLDTRIFADRDRTADSVVRVAKGLWDQWGPRMQSILEQTVKTLHEANEQMEAETQYTILDGLKLLSNDPFRNGVLKKVSDPYLLEWWANTFTGWSRDYKADSLAPVQTRLSYYASSKRAEGHPGAAPLHHRPAPHHTRRRHPAGLHLPGDGGQGRGRPGGRVPPQPR